MKVLSLFSGIGAFEKALDRQGIPYELVGFSEIDKYATKSYCAIHNVDESMNLGDITKIDEKKLPKDIDFACYGFPCQDISLAGKGKGLFNADGTKTRSGLFFDALRIIEETQPKVAIAENVKNLTGKKFKLQFEIVLKMLEAAGYNNYWQVLNAKDYGIPQNRERVFIVSIRKDIDTGFFKFPEGFPLELRLKDMLESKVDEKYYLPDEKVKDLVLNKTVGEPFIVASRGRNPENPSDRTPGVPTEQRLEPNSQGICNTLTTVQKDNLVVEPVCLNSKGGRGGVEGLQPSIQDRVYDSNAVSTAVTTCFVPSYLVEEPALTSASAGNEKIIVREATKQGYAEAEEGDSINIGFPNSKTRRGRVGKQIAGTLTTSSEMAVVVPSFEAKVQRVGSINSSQDGVVVDPNGIAPTHTAGHGNMPKVIVQEPINPMTNGMWRIRKLTPKECWRLMGFDDTGFEKAEATNSNTQLYKQAGNSIVVDTIEHLYKELANAQIEGFK